MRDCEKCKFGVPFGQNVVCEREEVVCLFHIIFKELEPTFSHNFASVDKQTAIICRFYKERTDDNN